MSALDTLRALSRSEPVRALSNEINEINELSSPSAPLRQEERAPPQQDEGPLSLNSFLSSPRAQNADDLEERAAIIEYGAGVPRAWAEGFAALSTMPPPTGFLPDRWARIVDAAGALIHKWASTAAACGWSDLEIFGCAPEAPDRRFDCMGLTLLLERCEIVALDRDGADLVMHKTGSRQRYRRRPLPPDTISLWQLSRTIPATGDEPEDDGPCAA